MAGTRGIVVATHPGDHSVDVLLRDGRRLVGVQVQTANGSTRSGAFDMPAVEKKGDKWDVSKPTGQEMIALVDFYDGQPVVSGFLLPQVSQMTFDDPKMAVNRHQSDFVHSIDGEGNAQWAHPSGAFIRIGESPDRADLAGKNTDKNLKVDRNTDKKVHIRLGTAQGTAVLTFAPDGAITITSEKTVNVTAKGAVSVKTEAEATVEAQGSVLVKTPAKVTIDAPNAICTGNLTVQKTLTYLGGMIGKGTAPGSGSTAAIEGNVRIVNGDLDVDGISSKTHNHDGVRAGGDKSGPPVGGGGGGGSG